MDNLLRDIKGFFQVIGAFLLIGWFLTGFGWAAIGMAFADYPIVGWVFLVINSIIWILIIIHRYIHRLEIFESTKKQFRNKN